MTSADRTFEQLVRDAEAAPFSGWDFSYLTGRAAEQPLPWDYLSRVRKHMASVDSVLDMGTGAVTGAIFGLTPASRPRY